MQRNSLLQVVLDPIRYRVCDRCRQYRDLAHGNAGLGVCGSALDW